MEPTDALIDDLREQVRPFDIGDLYKEAVRELEMRKSVYKRRVDGGKMTAKRAAHLQSLQRATVNLLSVLAAMEKARLPEQGELVEPPAEDAP